MTVSIDSIAKIIVADACALSAVQALLPAESPLTVFIPSNLLSADHHGQWRREVVPESCFQREAKFTVPRLTDVDLAVATAFCSKHDMLLDSADESLRCFEPLIASSLETLSESLLRVAARSHVAPRGRELTHKLKAQLMDLGDNFYERIKNKKCVIIRDLEPMMIAGAWVADMVEKLSAHYPSRHDTLLELPGSPQQLIQFAPDVILVALKDLTAFDNAKQLAKLQAIAGWESIPAVKRGEVVFVNGAGGMFLPGTALFKGTQDLVSALAGLESGFLSERDSFYRLRWVELHRHKFV